MNTDQVTRFEIIDHTLCRQCTNAARILCGACGGTGINGRKVIFHNPDKQLDLELQDDGQTLKVFIHERYED